MKTKTKQRISFIILLLGLTAFFAPGCGTKKSLSENERKEDTKIDLTDNSNIVRDIEQETQYLNTNIKERIVTFYGVRLDTIQVDGQTIIVPTYYPEKKEEERDISEDNRLWRVSTRDSIKNAVELTYRGQIDEKDRQLIQLKESKMILQIALLISALIGIILLVLYIRVKSKSRHFLGS